MYFRSTRDPVTLYGLREAIALGLAPDGGLFLPNKIPPDFVTRAEGDTFSEFATSLLNPFLRSAFSSPEIETICSNTFNFDVPITELSGDLWSGINVLELYHGPTHSFKDFGARFLGQVLRTMRTSSTDDRKTVVLVATSGDTGSAVADGLSNIDGVEVVILYPEDKVSPFQERQLTQIREGVTACRVNGTFDDCQALVKGAFSHPALLNTVFTSANSINIGRLLPQMTYYAWAASLSPPEVLFCVPSGNLGNLTAGMLALEGGMASSGFIAAHNANRFFPDALGAGNAETRKSIQTVSNAMDVGSPSNYERLASLFTPSELASRVKAFSVSDEETRSCMDQVFHETGYVADPHTSVGLFCAKRLQAERYKNRENFSGQPVIVLSTAHPAKFGSDTARGKQIDLLEGTPTDFISVDNSLSDVVEIILSRAATS